MFHRKSNGSLTFQTGTAGSLHLFQLEKSATFFCTFRKIEVASAKVALDLRTGDLISNGACGQLIAGQEPTS